MANSTRGQFQISLYSRLFTLDTHVDKVLRIVPIPPLSCQDNATCLIIVLPLAVPAL